MEVTEFPLKLLKMIGQGVEKNKIIFTIIQTIVMMFWFILAALRPIINNEGFEGWAAAFEIFGPTYEWTTKMIVYKVFKKTFRKLRKNLEEFWPFDTFDKETECKLRKLSKYVSIFFKCYMYSTILTLSVMTLMGLVTYRTTRQLPVAIYHIVDFTKSPLYEIVYILYIYHAILIVNFIVGFEGVFLTFMSAAAFQLILLKKGLKSIQVDTRADAIMSYDAIKKFIKDIKDAYSPYLIGQFIMSSAMVCMPIYLFYTGSDLDMVRIFRYILYSSVCVIQIFIYCITGTLIRTQMVSVADAMYESDWWKTDVLGIRNAAILIIQRANNVSSFKAGGIIALDLQSFINVLRTSFSFFTLMQSSEAKKVKSA